MRVLASFELASLNRVEREMASQVISDAVSQLQVLEIYSFLRGYYAYMEIIWTPVVGEILVLKIEPTNRHYIHAVAIYKMLKLSLAPRMSVF